MATTHIKRSTGASRLVNYAEKRAVLKDGINIDVDYAKTQLKQVREIYGNSGSTEAYASRIAFSPNELDPKNPDDQRKALAIARDIYEKTYPNQQVALYEQADTDSLHIHAVIGAINLETGNKIHGNWHEFREKLVENTDEIVKNYGLEPTVRDPERYEKRSMAEIKLAEKGKPSWKDEIRQTVDSVMSVAHISDFETFRDALREKAIEVYERGKDLTYQLSGTNYKARGNKLGTAYEMETIFNELERREQRQRDTTRTNATTINNGIAGTPPDNERTAELSRDASSITGDAGHRNQPEFNANSTDNGQDNSGVRESNSSTRKQSGTEPQEPSGSITQFFVGVQRPNKQDNKRSNQANAGNPDGDVSQQQQSLTDTRKPRQERQRYSGPSL
ncbi:relaxase/mobilization nuclease domain-containing protein [Weissella confusa]|uniref:relaxase/mobilization nuclease domain-containing protein n=1 Tax=Weissella confusa TaxID=1583 RepID=UPI0022E881E2|nr:relaxase/mobilization nuclease domain-containing protein [Weissella confusa]